jgi:alpha-tubulin suppressor-like RCC1 family protein
LCWGSADRGEIGTGAVSSPGLPGATTPRSVYLGNDMSIIASGFHSSCSANSSGLGYCWGRGTEGQLGNGAPRDEWSPIAVSDGDLSSFRLRFTSLGLGATHACGLTPEHIIYCWGDGADGQLGAGGLLRSPIAVRVAPAS